VFCEKPLGMNLADSTAMVAAAKGHVNMVGFNYIRTPASQYARALIANGEIGDVTWFRGEHTEDFGADPATPAHWRNQGQANGTMGDLAPHMVNAALALIGPIARLNADIATVHKTRPGPDGPVTVTNDDIGQFMCRFLNGAMGHLSFSRVAHGRKMGYAYDITGTTGAIRFDQEDQNALWLYRASDPPAERGFRKILMGPDHPDYLPFCQGPGHGTGYQDQIIIEARDFLRAIETRKPVWPTFADGMEVMRVIDAAHQSHATGAWVDL
jgi:predicted dehydrogenase